MKARQRILIAGLFLGSVPSFGVEIELSISARPAVLHASGSCRLESRDQLDRRVCLRSDLAHAWLASERPWAGRIKAEVRERLDLGGDGLSLELLTLPLPSKEPVDSWNRRWSEAVRSLDRLRLELSDRYSDWDRVGFVRSLVLSERSLGVLDILSSMGWGRWTAALGLEMILAAFFCEWLGMVLGQKIGIGPERSRLIAGGSALIVVLLLWLLKGAPLSGLRVTLIFFFRRWSEYWGLKLSSGWLWVLGIVFFAFVHAMVLLANGKLKLISFMPTIRLGFLFWGLWIGLELGNRRFANRPFLRILYLSVGAWVGLSSCSLLNREMIAPWSLLIQFAVVPFLVVLAPVLLLDGARMVFGLPSLKGLAFLLGNGELLLARLTLRQLPQRGAWWVVSPAAGFAALVLCVLLAFSFPFLKRLKWGWVLILLFGFLGRIAFFKFSEFSQERFHEVEVLQRDIGQGDGAWVFSGVNSFGFPSKQAEMIDAGSDRARTWLAFAHELSRFQIRKISTAYLTHWDEDHSGGLVKLSALVPIEQVIAPPPRDGIVLTGLIRHQVQLRSGEEEGGFEPLATTAVHLLKSTPLTRPSAGRKHRSGNDVMNGYSVALSRGWSYLSLGDADLQQERSWVRAEVFPKNRRWILKLSHHGSKTSTSDELLRALRPSEAWVSVGAQNRYGHPAWSVLDRVLALGIPVRRTDQVAELSSVDVTKEAAVHHP